MIVTEEEAKTKRCQESYGDGWTTPDGRMATLAGSPNGQALVASPYFCIGSACMAWRWQDQASPPELRGPSGYCGKAGRP